MRQTVHARRVGWALLALVAVGIGLRLRARFVEPPLHPDEYLQYLEPAWWHLTGNGVAAWEWHRGLRSWVLPFYNGAWMALLMQLGVTRGAQLGMLLQEHWAVLNASLVYIAYRGGSSLSRSLQAAQRDRSSADDASGWQAGLLAALLCAAFPLLVGYAPHTLSELPAMLCQVAGLVLAAELCEPRPQQHPDRKAALAGVLVSLSACLRIAGGPLALVAPLWLLVRRRFRALLIFIPFALLPVLLFGLSDLLTWGTFAGSFIEYVKFNLLENGAADFGTEPRDWYVETLRGRAPLGVWLLLGLALLGARASWPFLLSALGMIAYLSTQDHKEERFVIAFWPLLLIAAAATLGTWLARVRARGLQTALRVASCLLVLGVLVEGILHYSNGSPYTKRSRLRAQNWVGQQSGVTGVLIDEPYHSAGAMWLGGRAPLLPFSEGMLQSPIVTHVIVMKDSEQAQAATLAGFEVVHTFGGFVALARASARQGAQSLYFTAPSQEAGIEPR